MCCGYRYKKITALLCVGALFFAFLGCFGGLVACFPVADGQNTPYGWEKMASLGLGLPRLEFAGFPILRYRSYTSPDGIPKY